MRSRAQAPRRLGHQDRRRFGHPEHACERAERAEHADRLSRGERDDPRWLISRDEMSGSKDKSAERRERYRLQILEAAEPIFAYSGFEGAKMQDVAAAAGISLNTLY